MLESAKIREKIRNGEITGQTSGLARGFAQANLVVLPEKYAFDFLVFVQRNPKPCPLLEVTERGSPFPKRVAKDADLRFDIPRYRIYRNGKLEKEVTEIADYWQEDFVAFLLGCSFSFEWALMDAGIPVRHIEASRNVPMYITNIPTEPSGIFHGPLVVSMRPIPYNLVVKATNITARFVAVHGAPVHIGYPELIGIRDLNKPDYGDKPVMKDGDIPVFWACGVTPQAVAINAGVEFMITHSPGHMFITDLQDRDFALF